MLAARAEQFLSPWTDILTDFALCRMGADGGATRSDLVRDLGPFVGHKLSPSEFRQQLDETLDALTAAGLATATRGRYLISDRGVERVTCWLQVKELERDWPLIRDLQMTARALDMQGEPATRRRMLQRPDGLRMAIVQQAFDLKIRRVPTLARVRAALAGIALKRAFGNKLVPELGLDGAVDANASRMLAGNLAHRPRDFGTDSRLIAALAAEAVGAAQSDPGTLRLILLRQYVTRAISGTAGDGQDDREPSVVQSIASRTVRPDLEQFCEAVRAASDVVAQGWPGNRKAFISQVWAVVGERHADWGLTEIEFKSMLVEAHRSGQVMLANADLKNRTDLDEFQRSAVTYKNTVWHFVRLDT